MKERTKSAFFYTTIFAVFMLVVWNIYPLSDDWYYKTAPNMTFELVQLLPQAVFWRPFDALFGGLMGFIPSLFPYLNRAAVIFSHVLSAFLLMKILNKMNFSKAARNFTMLFFLFSASMPSVIVSPDALNQSFCLLFGLIGLYIHLNKGGYYFLIFAFLSMMWKESGISWLFVIPTVELIMNADKFAEVFKNKKILKRYVLCGIFAVAVAALYFILRFVLMGDVELGSDDGNYQISIFSLDFIKNIVILFGSSMTGIDSLAVFGPQKNIALLAVTGILSLVFLIFILVCFVNLIKDKKGFFKFFMLALCALAFAAPQAIIGHSGEMHAYPVALGVALIYGYCITNGKISGKAMAASFACIFLALAISNTHKFVTIYDYSARTEAVTESMHEKFDDPNDKILTVVVNDEEGYSVFTHSGIYGANYGTSLRQFYDWKVLDIQPYKAETREQAESYIENHAEEYDCIFLVDNSDIERAK